MILRLLASLYVLGLVALAATACATIADPAATPGRFDREVARIQRLIGDGKYAEAKKASDEYLQAAGTFSFLWEARFYQARALQGQGLCPEAVPRFREVAIATQPSRPHLAAQALYEMAFCLEDMGKSEQAIAVLIDLRERQAWLPPEVAGVEIPARLATEYSIVGNKVEAQRYFAEVETAMRGLVNIKVESTPIWLPRTLYYMGYIPLPIEQTEESSQQLLLLIESNQRHLIKAMEFGDVHWAEQAAAVFIRAYGRLLEDVRKVAIGADPADPALAERQAQERRWALAHAILRATHNFKLARLPREAPVSSAAGKADRFIDDLEKQLAQVLAEPPVAAQLTPEAGEREGLRRPGRVVGEESVLEQEQLKQQGSATKTEGPVP